MSKKRTNPKPRRRPAKPKAPQAPMNHMGLARAVCSITDPFCPAARGSRWPDNTTAPSLPLTTEGMINLTTDANGNAAILLLPSFPKGYWVATSINNTTGVATFPPDGLSYAGSEDFAATARQYRLVSGGVKLTSITSLANSQGYFRATEISGTEGLNNDFSTIDLGTMAQTAMTLRPVRESGSIFGFFKPSGPKAREFVSYVGDDEPAFTINDVSSNDWTALVISVTGAAPSSTIGILTYLLHFELTFKQGSALNRFAPAAKAPNLMLTNASSVVTSKMSSFLSGTVSVVEKAIMDKAGTYAKSLLAFGANRMLPGSGTAMLALSNAMEVD